MTVMPSGSDVADKAVSTEDTSELIQLDAVLASLVDTKIAAIKRASLSSSRGKWTSGEGSPRRPRLMSSSTASSSQNRNHDNLTSKHFDRGSMEDKRKSYRQRRYDSAPCQRFIEEIDDHRHQDAMAHKELKSRRRASEMIHRNPKKKRHYSRRISSHVLQGIDSPIELPELLDVDRLHDDLTLIQYERTREALIDNGDYPSLHQSAYVSPSPAHIKLAYEDEDYVALNIEDEFDGESIMSGHYRRELAREHRRSTLGERYHRPRKKHKRKKHRNEVYLPEVNDVPQVVLIDHDELPLRARWTIVATACLLFAMSLLLVGITLRMAPIIDDMGDERRASLRGKKPSSGRRRSVSSDARRKSSVRALSTDLKDIKNVKVEPQTETEQMRRHRRVVALVLGIFIFLLVASVVVVIVTLTHSSFHSPPVGDKDLAIHRAQQNQPLHRSEIIFRKENEELLNSLNRDISVPDNSTTPPL